MSEALSTCPFCNSNEHLTIEAVGSLLPDMPGRPYRVVCAHIDHDTVTGPVAYGLAAAITAWNHRPTLERKVAELEAEVHRLANNTSRYPELMARIQSAKSEGTDSRIIALREALCELPPDFFNYQWEADEKPAFGEKFVRTVAGNNGLGMGRQWVATTPHHISGLARFIAAANPDTVGLLLAQLQAAEVGKARLSKALRGTTASLVAAVSLLKRGSKKAAPSNKMFDQMILDYSKSIEEARAALSGSSSGWREPNEGHVYSASDLARLLEGRDAFIVAKGLWEEFTAMLAASPAAPQQGGE